MDFFLQNTITAMVIFRVIIETNEINTRLGLSSNSNMAKRNENIWIT